MMEAPYTPIAGNEFKTPEEFLGQLNACSAAKLITAAADIALVLDRDDVIRDLACSGSEWSADSCEGWVGRRWVETVTVESRNKIEQLLHDARTQGPIKLRQVNHPTKHGLDVPIRYSAVSVGNKGEVIAVGRDLSSVATLQQRLLAVQQSMEREYSRSRNAETRYRLLFQIASEPVLIFDAASEKLIEANPAASAVMGRAAKDLTGSPLSKIFDAGSLRSVKALIASVRFSGKSDEIEGRLAGCPQDFRVSVSLFRNGRQTHILVHLKSETPGTALAPAEDKRAEFIKVVENLPDGFVVTDSEMRILTANNAFLDLTEAASAAQVEGTSLDQFIGRSAVDLNVIVSSLHQHGSVKNFATVLRGRLGALEHVDVSAVRTAADDSRCYGFSIRPAAVPTSKGIDNAFPKATEQISGLIGRAPLKDIVRETTDLIERFCIEAALDLTENNRASAAEMLGLSRQSLYSKLRRHGIGNLS